MAGLRSMKVTIRVPRVHTPPIPGLTNDVNGQMEGMIEIVSKTEGRPVSIQEADRFFWFQGFRFILDQPVSWLLLEWKKLLLVVRLQEIGLIYNLYLEQEEYLPIHRLFVINWGILMALAFLGLADLYFIRRSHTRRLVPVLWTGGAITGILLAFFVVTRYRMLLLPVAALFASHGAISLIGWLREKRVLIGLAGSLLVCGVLLATFTGEKGNSRWHH